MWSFCRLGFGSAAFSVVSCGLFVGSLSVLILESSRAAAVSLVLSVSSRLTLVLWRFAFGLGFGRVRWFRFIFRRPAPRVGRPRLKNFKKCVVN